MLDAPEVRRKALQSLSQLQAKVKENDMRSELVNYSEQYIEYIEKYIKSFGLEEKPTWLFADMMYLAGFNDASKKDIRDVIKPVEEKLGNNGEPEIDMGRFIDAAEIMRGDR